MISFRVHVGAVVNYGFGPIAEASIDVFQHEEEGKIFGHDCLMTVKFQTYEVKADESYITSRAVVRPDGAQGDWRGWFSTGYSIPNNSYGDPADNVYEAAKMLKRIAKVTQRFNLAYRWQGDEMAVLMAALRELGACEVDYEDHGYVARDVVSWCVEVAS